MPVETITIADLKSRVSFHVTNDPTVQTTPINMGTEYEWALEWALRDVVSKTNHPAFRAEGTFSTVDGTADYYVGDDFWRMIEPGVYLDADPKYPLKYYEEQDRIRDGWVYQITTKDRPRFWTLRGRDSSTGLQVVRLVPTPDAVYTIRYLHLALPNRVVGATNLDPRFPRDKVELLAVSAALQLPQYLSSSQLAVLSARYQELIIDFHTGKDPVVGYSPQRERISPPEEMSTNTQAWPQSITGTPYQT